LIGRNGGGKSNALDALEVLSRLARGGEIRDALDGARRDAGPVRGGIEGCPPIGSDTFELGATIAGPPVRCGSTSRSRYGPRSRSCVSF
jgi:energy-coupling factor transporter ATP-binding protein EcfA2